MIERKNLEQHLYKVNSSLDLDLILILNWEHWILADDEDFETRSKAWSSAHV